MEWCIAGRGVKINCRDVCIPESFADIFSAYLCRPHDTNLILPIDIDVVFRPDWPIEVPNFGIDIVENGNGSIRKILTRIPGASGFFVKSSNGYSGRFDLEADSVFGLLATLQIALALLVEDAGGLLLHASGVLRDGKVWLFCGPSGAGKTTIATELRERGELFSTDRVVVEFDDSGKLIASSTPFGDSPEEISRPRTGTVAGIAFISQALETRVVEVTTFEATRTMFRQSRWYSSNATATQRTLDNIARIVQTDLCFRLEFEKTTEFWTRLDEWKAKRENSGVLMQ
jgi:hypothetical protein